MAIPRCKGSRSAVDETLAIRRCPYCGQRVEVTCEGRLATHSPAPARAGTPDKSRLGGKFI